MKQLIDVCFIMEKQDVGLLYDRASTSTNLLRYVAASFFEQKTMQER